MTAHGLILPPHLRHEHDQARDEPGRVEQLPNGATVKQRAVWMGRQGWRHEVAASWPARDGDGPVQRTDVLWLADVLDADRLRRAAADELRAGELRDGLSALARRLGLQLP